MSGSAAVDHEVIVIGAGPTGLLMAAELRRAGVDVALLERRVHRDAPSRAIGVHPAVLAALEASGAADRILSEASRITHGQVRAGRRVLGEVRFENVRTRHPFIASVPQQVTEQAVADGGPEPCRGVHVQNVRDRGTYVAVECHVLKAQRVLRARMVVVTAGTGGADLLSGCEPAVRSYPDQYVMSDLAGVDADAVEDEHLAAIVLHREGVVESFPLPHGRRRLVAWDHSSAIRRGSVGPKPWGTSTSDPQPMPHASSRVERSTAALRLCRAVEERMGAPELAARIEQVSTFGIRRALLPRLRYGRIVVIGDSAHEVSPIGGQGMNLGLLDAATLATPLTNWLRLGEPPGAIERWEDRRLRSARRAARLATINTGLGRPRSLPVHGLTTLLATAAMSGRVGREVARIYAMGLDLDANISTPGWPPAVVG